MIIFPRPRCLTRRDAFTISICRNTVGIITLVKPLTPASRFGNFHIFNWFKIVSIFTRVLNSGRDECRFARQSSTRAVFLFPRKVFRARFYRGLLSCSNFRPNVCRTVSLHNVHRFGYRSLCSFFELFVQRHRFSKSYRQLFCNRCTTHTLLIFVYIRTFGKSFVPLKNRAIATKQHLLTRTSVHKPILSVAEFPSYIRHFKLIRFSISPVRLG